MSPENRQNSAGTHDPLCPDQDSPNGGWLLCDFCNLIELVRADEVNRIYGNLSDET